MYEHMTFETLLDRMLDKVPQNVDKREGSIIYDALAPCAAELQLMYIELDNVLSETFADTARREYLIRRAKERGLSPYVAKPTALRGVFTPESIEINIGSRFSLDDLNYRVIDKITDGIYILECETYGKVGNTKFGDLIPIDYIDGLESAKLVDILVLGEDEEDTEDFRKRYFESFKSQAFGGNIADYKEKVGQMQGVGALKVIPTWAGAGTVKLIIISSDYTAPTDDFLKIIKEKIDPYEHSGNGYGIAPIGHKVTVEGVEDRIINIRSKITFQEGYNFDVCKPFIEKAIDKYFIELAKKWDSEDKIVVRVSQIETRILSVNGVIDISDTLLNEKNANLILSDNEIPKRGIVSWIES